MPIECLQNAVYCFAYNLKGQWNQFINFQILLNSQNIEKDNINQARQFNFTFRYIDDLITLNNPTFYTFNFTIYSIDFSCMATLKVGIMYDQIVKGTILKT